MLEKKILARARAQLSIFSSELTLKFENSTAQFK